jgi:hypothetical protein
MYTRLIFLSCLIVFQGFAAGPFGFEYGMTKEQVIAAVGQNAVKKIQSDVLTLTTAPKPHPAFETYQVMISPKLGLVKILAIGNTIGTNRYGNEIQTAFIETQEALVNNYGTPGVSYDFLRSGSIWAEHEDWMMGLAKGERVLATFWTPTNSPNHITSIELEANALSMEKGYLDLGYEFEGFPEYAQSKKTDAGKVF